MSYSGFRANNTLYSPFYAPAIATPSLHAIGTLDTVVEAERSEELLHACAEGSRQLLHHPGGHYVPSTQRHILALLFSFIKQALSSSTYSGV